MDQINNFLNEKMIISIIAIIVIIIIFKVLNKLTNKQIKIISNKTNHSKKKSTYIKLVGNIIKYVLILFIVMIILNIYGINVNSIIAGLGVVSVVIGLALQDALKDIIIGVNIILDDYFSVGDVVKINNIEGKVISIGLKTTKVKDIYTQNIYSVANRNITETLNISDQLDIDIPISYNQKIERMERVIDEIMLQISETDDTVKKIEYRGVNEFGESAVYYKIRIMCEPETKPQTKRNSLRTIKSILDFNNIEIPFNQLDVTIKK